MTVYTEVADGGCLCGGSSPVDQFHPSTGGILAGGLAQMAADWTNCTAWQTWAGANYANQVFCVGQGADMPGGIPTPFAVFGFTSDGLNLQIATQTYNRGSMYLYVQDNTPPWYADDPTSACNYFLNNIDAVLAQFMPPGNGGMLKRNIRFLQEPLQSKVEDTENNQVTSFYTVSFVIDFGPEGA